MTGFTASQRKAILDRDGHQCVPHGGTCNGALVIHHRANRGMGGRRSANVVSNGLTVCHEYNTLMEGDSITADHARFYGYKISTSANPRVCPVYYPATGDMWLLDDYGGREKYQDDVPF